MKRFFSLILALAALAAIAAPGSAFASKGHRFFSQRNHHHRHGHRFGHGQHRHFDHHHGFHYGHGFDYGYSAYPPPPVVIQQPVYLPVPQPPPPPQQVVLSSQLSPVLGAATTAPVVPSTSPASVAAPADHGLQAAIEQLLKAGKTVEITLDANGKPVVRGK